MRSEYILHTPASPHDDNVNGIFAGLLTSGKLYAKAAIDRLSDRVGNQGALKTFYVDRNNPVNGDGSVINPFKSLDLVRAKIIGTGSLENPQYNGYGVKVFAGAYTTLSNLAIVNTTWYFDEGAVITGINCPGALFDNSTHYSGSYVKVVGRGEFIVNGTSLVKAEGANSGTVSNIMIFEALKVTNTYVNYGNPELYPIFIATSGAPTADNAFQKVLTVKIIDQVHSYSQTPAIIDNQARCNFEGGRWIVSNGNDALSSNGRIFKIIRSQLCEIQNLSAYASSFDYLFEIGHATSGLGAIRQLNINNVLVGTGTASGPQAKRVILVKAGTTVSMDGEGGLNAPYMRVNVTQGDGQFAESTDMINFEGDGFFTGLELVRCYFRGRISDKIYIAGFPNNPNVFGSLLRLANTPAYTDDAAAGAAGLISGEVYKTFTGILMIKT